MADRVYAPIRSLMDERSKDPALEGQSRSEKCLLARPTGGALVRWPASLTHLAFRLGRFETGSSWWSSSVEEGRELFIDTSEDCMVINYNASP